MREPFEFIGPDGRQHYGLITSPEPESARPTIVLCHGFKSFFEWGFHPPLASLLAERGFTVVQFNFRGSGMRPGDELVTDEEAFRNATFSGDLDQLNHLLAQLGETVAAGRVDRDRIGLFGHSRGGGLAILGAAEAAGSVHALVTWNSVGTFARFDEQQIAHWRQQGTVEIANGRTGQVLPMGVEVLEDLENHPERLDVAAAASRRSAPWLIVHGEEDETVSVDDAHRLSTVAGGQCELLLIAAGNHTLGARHPFVGPTPPLIQAMNATQTWFRRHLS